jgi:hypothetical protein
MRSGVLVSEQRASILLGFSVLNVLEQVLELLGWHAQEKAVEGTLERSHCVFHFAGTLDVLK